MSNLMIQYFKNLLINQDLTPAEVKGLQDHRHDKVSWFNIFMHDVGMVNVPQTLGEFEAHFKEKLLVKLIGLLQFSYREPKTLKAEKAGEEACEKIGWESMVLRQ